MSQEEVALMHDRALQVRQNNAVLSQLNHDLKVEEQRARIAALQAEVAQFRGTSEPGGSIEDKLLAIILDKVISSPRAEGGAVASWDNSSSPSPTIINSPILAAQAPPAPPETPPTPSENNLSDDNIRALLKEVPPMYLKMAKNMPADTIKGFLRSQGNFSEDTLNRAINIIKQG